MKASQLIIELQAHMIHLGHDPEVCYDEDGYKVDVDSTSIYTFDDDDRPEDIVVLK